MDKRLRYRTLSAAVVGVGAAACLCLGWLLPGSSLCAVAGWAAVFLFSYLALEGHALYRASYLCGLVIHLVAFHWLFTTIGDFGGFGLIERSLIFALFAVVSSFQLPLWVFIYRSLPKALDYLALRIGVAWVIAEFISIRIFPWSVAHMQLAFQPLVQLAEFGGTALIVLLVFWVCESILRLSRKELKPVFFVAPALLCLVCVWGVQRIKQVSYLPGNKHKVALIQANISTEEKHNVKLFKQNTERYVELSKKLPDHNLLVIWPEAVIQDFIPANIGKAQLDLRLPQPSNQEAAYLVGGLSFDSREKYYNSAIAIMPDGAVPYPYHKRILMPFGEYTPLVSIFPWIRDIHPTPDFTPGDGTKVFEFPLMMSDGGKFLGKLAALICYEDIVPSLSRDAVQQGAELLVNLTNDAWFGDTVAPLQHNLIASFRAIENRRYLLRSTNSGLTAIINPLGLTVASLPTFSEGVLSYDVQFLSERTLYTSLVGDKFNWLLLGFWLLCLPFWLWRKCLKK